MHYGEYLESVTMGNTDTRSEAEKMLDDKYEWETLKSLKSRIDDITRELSEMEARKKTLEKHLAKKERDYSRRKQRYIEGR